MAVRRKKNLGSYPYASVLFSITMALFVIGVFGLLVIYANKLSRAIKENIEMHVYLDHNLSDDFLIRLKNFIQSQPYVNEYEGKKQISYITKEAAAKKFIKETGEDFVKFLGENPLRDSFVLKIHPDYSETATLKLIKIQLEKQEGIYEAVFIESIVDAINKNLARVSVILLSFALILIGVVLVLIDSSIRLALYSQRFLIRSMQLVGATSAFIKWPFLSRAFLHGATGGILASALLLALIYYAYMHIPELQMLENPRSILYLMIGLVFFGGVLGFISSYRAMNKYLRMSLNDLY